MSYLRQTALLVLSKITKNLFSFFSYNVPDSSVNEHLPTNISYSGVGKYCTNLKGVIFLTLTLVNKFKKFRFLIEEETIFLCLSLSLFLFLFFFFFFFCSF